MGRFHSADAEREDAKRVVEVIQITDKGTCCGCQACGDSCPKGAITFKTDAEGFWYPEVDAARCVGCGLCERVCPMTHLDAIKAHGQTAPTVYGGFHNNLSIRFDSTSGGAFSALANVMYKQGGCVTGAIQRSDDWRVFLSVSENKRDLPRLRSSKYVQSSAEGFYRKVKDLLEQGRPVLACGAPCQMAALRSFLGKDYERLIVVDFVCRATNSPLAYAKYLDWLERTHDSKIVSVKAKNKEHGWRSLARKVVFASGAVYYGEGEEDPYRRGYHRNYYQRPSCHVCPFKGFPRCADITLGDFWGIERVDPKLDHNLGTSCILVNTPKGAAFFERVRHLMTLREFPLEAVLRGNREPLMTPAPMPNYDRAAFFADLRNLPFEETAARWFPISERRPPTFKSIAKATIKAVRRLVWQIVRDPAQAWRQIRWNLLCPQVKTEWLRGILFNVLGHCSLDIRKRGRIVVEKGVFTLGSNRNRKSRRETRLLVEDGAELHIKAGGYIGSGADVQLFSGARLELGVGDCFNSGLQIVCAERIVIGDDVHVGRDVWIRDNNGEHYIIQPGYTWKAPVTIGDRCWIGSNVAIMKGVTIGEGTVVAANAVVTHSLPAHCLAAGNPAEVVAEDIRWRP